MGWGRPSGASRQAVKYLIARTYVLRLGGLYVIIARVLRTTSRKEIDCWETAMGQQLYKLMVLGSIFAIFGSFAVDMGWHWFYHFAPSNCGIGRLKEMLGPPQFNIADSYSDVVYLQSVLWLGVFFSPLLAVLGLVAVYVLFFTKYYSSMWGLEAPRTRYRMRTGENFAYFLLLLTVFLASVPVGFTIGNIEPSVVCTPFRGQHSFWQVVPDTVRQWPDRLRIFIFFLGSEGFVIPLVVVLLLVCFYYYNRRLVFDRGMRDLHVALSKQQEEKRWLIQEHGLTKLAA